jgi:hypothetical protein
MPKIVMYSDLWLPTFPYLDIPLYKELKSRGIDVRYVLQEGDIRLVDNILSFYPDITQTIAKPKDVVGLLNKDDLLLMRFVYKGIGGEVAEKARTAGHKILMLDPAAIDLKHRECPAQYITAKS